MANKIQQIRKEYGEPFTDVVKGYAAMRYSKRFTASVFGINYSYFLQILTRFDLHRFFVSQAEMVRECNGGGGGWPKGVPRNLGPRYDFDDMLAEVRRYPDRSLYETMADIHITTIYRHFGSFQTALAMASWRPGETTYHYYRSLWEKQWGLREAA